MSNIEKAIVQIFSDKGVVDWSRPWSITHKERSTGSGWCTEIPGFKKERRFIITNAHCVDQSSYCTVRFQGVSKAFRAKVEAIGYEVDLAIVSVADEAFWKHAELLELGDMPKKLTSVQVFGFPLGGLNISITQGVVNRINIIPYFHVTRGAAIQIDAAINPGNSGGPAIGPNGKVVGVAFAGEDEEYIQNMGYIIPPLVVRYFMEFVKKHKTYGGLCTLGVITQNLNNAVLREYYKLEPHQTGVVVTGAEETSNLFKKIEMGDVIMKINGVNIDSDGTISARDLFNNTFYGAPTLVKQSKDTPGKQIIEVEDRAAGLVSDERVPFTNLVALRLPDENATLTVLRKGKMKELKFKTQLTQFLVPILPYQTAPAYYIVGGLVFVPLTMMMVDTFLEDGVEASHLLDAESMIPHVDPTQQVIVLTEILLTEMTDGYDDSNHILHTVNDMPILNLEHLYEEVQAALKKEKYIKFEFHDTGDIIVLKCADVKKYSKSIAFDQLGLSDIYVND